MTEPNGQPLVSVVTATWNAADYLREAIESALAQSYRPLEIVVVDDGSTDHTAEVCASFGDRIRYIYQPKDDKAGATAHVRALREARGDYLAGLDHDDRWLPDKIARQVACLQARPEAGVVFTRFRLIDGAGRDKGPSDLIGPSGEVFHTLLRANRYCYSSGLYPRAVLDAVGHHDIEAGIGDWDLWLRIARHYRVAMLDEELTEYRVHDANYSVDRHAMAESLRRVLENQRGRLHPGCALCRRAFNAGIADAYLLDFHTAARAGRLTSALHYLGRALKTSPWPVLKPRHLPALVRSLIWAAVLRRTGPPATDEVRNVEPVRRA